MSLNKYMDNDGFSPIPCPNCGSKVRITNSRDCRVLNSYAQCTGDCSCLGSYFSIESESLSIRSDELLQSDCDIVAIKYYNWASSDEKIEGYRCNGEWD